MTANSDFIATIEENEVETKMKLPIRDNESVKNVSLSLKDPMNNPEIVVTVYIEEDIDKKESKRTFALTT